MNIIDELKYSTLPYSKYVKFSNEILRLSQDNKYSNEEKCELLQLLHDAKVDAEETEIEEYKTKLKDRLHEISETESNKMIR